MARLPSSFRKRNRTTRPFRVLYAALPTHVKSGVRDTCVVFDNDPYRKSLRRHDLKPNRRGKHRDGSISISVTLGYRAIYVPADGINVWYWIGTHADYDTFVGRK
jgi:hypothetical protein